MGLPGRIITPNHTNFNRTYFTQSRSKSTDVDNILRQFWEIEETPSRDYGTMNAEVHLAVNKVKNSMKYQDGRYQVAIPWKEDPSNLPENYNMALKRLKNTEKWLAKDLELSGAYSNVILQYLAKKYIRKVPKEEPRPSCVWYLPHFSVLRPDKPVTKIRIVFDASAKSREVSLNDVMLQVPKLQQDLNNILLRFQRHPVAIVCDISEMYL